MLLLNLSFSKNFVDYSSYNWLFWTVTLSVKVEFCATIKMIWRVFLQKFYFSFLLLIFMEKMLTESYLPVRTWSDRDRSNNIRNCFWAFVWFRRSSFRFLSPCWSRPLSPKMTSPTKSTKSRDGLERHIIWKIFLDYFFYGKSNSVKPSIDLT